MEDQKKQTIIDPANEGNGQRCLNDCCNKEKKIFGWPIYRKYNLIVKTKQGSCMSILVHPSDTIVEVIDSILKQFRQLVEHEYGANLNSSLLTLTSQGEPLLPPTSSLLHFYIGEGSKVYLIRPSSRV